ncbi:MAG: hypothetical protein HC869_03040 [Rhodospirillales bacterium]|nr:hypothetical protein [Rhodospirillales bacterium]
MLKMGSVPVEAADAARNPARGDRGGHRGHEVARKLVETVNPLRQVPALVLGPARS